MEKEQEYNHQRQGSIAPRSAFTAQDVMELIGYDQLQKEFASWGSLLKNTLGRLQTPQEERRYQQITQEILIEVVNQLAELLNNTKTPNQIIKTIKDPAFSAMMDEFLDRWDQMRNVKAYVAAAVKTFHRDRCLLRPYSQPILARVT